MTADSDNPKTGVVSSERLLGTPERKVIAILAVALASFLAVSVSPYRGEVERAEASLPSLTAIEKMRADMMEMLNASREEREQLYGRDDGGGTFSYLARTYAEKETEIGRKQAERRAAEPEKYSAMRWRERGLIRAHKSLTKAARALALGRRDQARVHWREAQDHLKEADLRAKGKWPD